MSHSDFIDGREYPYVISMDEARKERRTADQNLARERIIKAVNRAIRKKIIGKHKDRISVYVSRDDFPHVEENTLQALVNDVTTYCTDQGWDVDDAKIVTGWCIYLTFL